MDISNQDFLKKIKIQNLRKEVKDQLIKKNINDLNKAMKATTKPPEKKYPGLGMTIKRDI